MNITSSASDHRPRLNDVLIQKVQRSITDRDLQICQLLEEHRVLTTQQIANVFFPTYRAARERLVTLYRYRILDRFRPLHAQGSAPFHYTLDVLGTAACAAERGETPRYKTTTIAESWQRSSRLEHLLNINQFFTDLWAHGINEDGELVEWWSERRCAQEMAGIVFPDGFGEWRAHGRSVDFYLEVDRSTEDHRRLQDKLVGYQRLRDATGVDRPILFWVPSIKREQPVRQALSGTDLKVATAVTNTTPWSTHWLNVNGTTRQSLIELGAGPGSN